MTSVLFKGIATTVIALGALAALSLSAHAETIGFSLTNRGFNGDTESSVDAILLTPFSQSGVITSWSFFNNAPSLTQSVTPFLATRTGTDSYTITSVGTTRTNAGTGIQSFLFGAISGTATVDSNTYFGFHSGGTANGQTGVIELDTNAATTEQFALRRSSNAITTGTTGTFTAYGDRRVYSVQAVSSAVTVVPEAGTYALLGSGLLPLVGIVARRRRAA